MKTERLTFAVEVHVTEPTRFVLGNGGADWLDLFESGRYVITTAPDYDTLTVSRAEDTESAGGEHA